MQLVHCFLTLASCSAEREETSHGVYNWPLTSAEEKIDIYCQYGRSDIIYVNPMARRYCDEYGEWVTSNFTECASFSISTLRNISMVSYYSTHHCGLILRHRTLSKQKDCSYF